jgi:uncharacterized protein YaeQ
MSLEESSATGLPEKTNLSPFMALKAIIHKATVNVSDLDRNLYSDHTLTLARHPSETEERMLLRLIAYVLNAPPNRDHGALEFAKDMWEPDEPALWQKDLTGLLMHEIELGLPEEKRLVRACGRAKKVTVYTYSNTSATWWSSVSAKLARVRNLTVWQLPADQVQALGTLADKTMELQLTLQEGTWWLTSGDQSAELTPTCLFGDPLGG